MKLQFYFMGINLAEREGFEPAAVVLPKILANFRSYYQRYQSLATVARIHFTSILGKSNRRHFGSNGSQVWTNLRTPRSRGLRAERSSSRPSLDPTLLLPSLLRHSVLGPRQ